MKTESVLPNDWTPEQADAVGDFFWAVYEHLIDLLTDQYPAALFASSAEDQRSTPPHPLHHPGPSPDLEDIPY